MDMATNVVWKGDICSGQLSLLGQSFSCRSSPAPQLGQRRPQGDIGAHRGRSLAVPIGRCCCHPVGEAKDAANTLQGTGRPQEKEHPTSRAIRSPSTDHGTAVAEGRRDGGSDPLHVLFLPPGPLGSDEPWTSLLPGGGSQGIGPSWVGGCPHSAWCPDGE